MKPRLLFRQLIDFIENDTDYHTALIAGARRTGKTTLLKQLKQLYGDDAEYIDLTEAGITLETLGDKLPDSRRKLFLLDEIAYLGQYELIAQALFDYKDQNTGKKPKIIITGSSAAHIVKLSGSKLGCRARLFRLPLLTFVEYLYFIGKIQSYEDYSTVSNTDFADYLQLKDLASSPAGELGMPLDAYYYRAFYDEVAISNRMSRLAYSIMDLGENDLINLINILAYKLSEASGYEKTMAPPIGGQEHIHLFNQQIKVKMNKVDLSSTIIADSVKAVPGITCEDIGRILHFLLWSGIAIIEHTRTSLDISPRDTASVLEAIRRCRNAGDFEALFSEVSICLVSPLYYTRIGKEILERMNVPVDKLYKGMLFGKMLELYIRGALAMRRETSVLTTSKLNLIGVGEVDVWDNQNRILCEVSSFDKGDRETAVHSYFPKHEFIRVCSSATRDFFSKKYQYYQIPYAKLCCMIDTGDIFKLQRTAGPVEGIQRTPC